MWKVLTLYFLVQGSYRWAWTSRTERKSGRTGKWNTRDEVRYVILLSEVPIESIPISFSFAFLVVQRQSGIFKLAMKNEKQCIRDLLENFLGASPAVGRYRSKQAGYLSCFVIYRLLHSSYIFILDMASVICIPFRFPGSPWWQWTDRWSGKAWKGRKYLDVKY